MAATAAIAAIGAAISRQLITPEMLDSRTAMPAFTKDSYLVYEIALLQGIVICSMQR